MPYEEHKRDWFEQIIDFADFCRRILPPQLPNSQQVSRHFSSEKFEINHVCLFFSPFEPINLQSL